MKGLLIINADDLGMSPEINKGIISGLRQEVISDTSLITKGPCAASAVRELVDLGILHAGIHVDLDQLFGWKPGGVEIYPRAYLMKMLENEDFLKVCAREIRNQIELFFDFNLIPTHIDTHHHVHGFPEIFFLLLSLVSEFNIPAMRFNKGGYHLPTRMDIPFKPETFLCMEHFLREKGIYFSDNYLENAASISSVKDGITELVVHPSVSGDMWRMEELKFLMSDDGVKRWIPDDIRLISFKDLFNFLPEHRGCDSGKSGSNQQKP
jgi:chitin disaccharide deacetylase